MIWYALAFFLAAMGAALLGFTGVASAAAEVAKFLFFGFLIAFVVALVAGFMAARDP